MRQISNYLPDYNIIEFVNSIEKDLLTISSKRTGEVAFGLEKILKSFRNNQIGVHHFSSLTGYAHGDLGREVIDKVFADVFGAEKAAVRMQFVSGTHAISSALFGVLRPGDNLLSITGRPYDTLEEVIGLRGSNQGSLKDFGVEYNQINIFREETYDFTELEKALDNSVKMIFIQRSCGYTWRPSMSIDLISKVCAIIHNKQPECVCFVDNCYGEFVERMEPTEVGADLIAGSLIKNPGGTIVPAGGYLAGKADLVEKACFRLTAPGIGIDGGSSFDLNRIILQGFFLSPQMVSESLIGADLVAGVFHKLGFDVKPLAGGFRGDVIQAVRIGDEKLIKEICRVFQNFSPVGSFLNPISSKMPGYQNELIMSGGTFIDGSTSEFSADAPLRPPYNLYVQGGTHRSHIKLALIQAISRLVQAGFVDLPQTS